MKPKQFSVVKVARTINVEIMTVQASNDSLRSSFWARIQPEEPFSAVQYAVIRTAVTRDIFGLTSG
jgi:hypothetical protein